MNFSLLGLGSEKEKPAYLEVLVLYLSLHSWLTGGNGCSGEVKAWVVGSMSGWEGWTEKLVRLALGVQKRDPILEVVNNLELILRLFD